MRELDAYIDKILNDNNILSEDLEKATLNLRKSQEEIERLQCLLEQRTNEKAILASQLRQTCDREGERQKSNAEAAYLKQQLKAVTGMLQKLQDRNASAELTRQHGEEEKARMQQSLDDLNGKFEQLMSSTAIKSHEALNMQNLQMAGKPAQANGSLDDVANSMTPAMASINNGSTQVPYASDASLAHGMEYGNNSSVTQDDTAGLGEDLIDFGTEGIDNSAGQYDKLFVRDMNLESRLSHLQQWPN